MFVVFDDDFGEDVVRFGCDHDVVDFVDLGELVGDEFDVVGG